MISDLFRSIPGWLIEHWFIGAILAIVFLSFAYIALLKTWSAAEEVRDIRRRNRNR
jgi:hypothetical protein